MRKRTWRIGLVANSAWHLHHFWRHLIDFLKTEGHTVIGFAPDGAERKELESCHLHAFIPVRQLRPQGTNPVQEIRLMTELARKYRQARLDLVVHFTIKPCIYGGLAARLTGTPAIPTITGLGYTFIHPYGLNRFVPHLYKSAFKRSPLVVFLNREDAGLFVEKGIIREDQAFLSPGAGIDTEHFAPKPASSKTNFVFLFLGRLLLDKGIEELMQAFEKLQQKEPAVECWVGGDDRAENPAIIRAKRWKHYMSQPGVKYLGLVEDVRPYLAQADVLVLPSYREGMPMVVLEAMAMGKPVIATQTAGCREAVTAGENGWLVPVKSVNALLEVMQEACHTHPGRLQEMGQAGRRQAVQKFEQHLVQQTFLHAIHQLMDQPS